jgi:ribonucleotide monophosphatase NagD (HAD superfamily)
MMHKISGLREIARDFNAMLIDQFGILHDGHKLYPGAAEAMAELHRLNIPVIITTNSGKRSKAALSKSELRGSNLWIASVLVKLRSSCLM